MLVLVNLVVFAEPEIIIGEHDSKVSPGFRKFKEPTITIVDGNKVVTDRFSITYLINGKTDSNLETNGNGQRVTKSTNGTEVEYLFGDVVFGGAETVTIKVVATPKAGYGYTEINKTYSVEVEALTANAVFTPEFTEISSKPTVCFKAMPVEDVWSAGQYKINSLTSDLPKYKVTIKNSANVVTDISEYFDVSIVYTPEANSLVTYNEAKNNLVFAGSGWESFTGLDAANTAAVNMQGRGGTLTYTFTPKGEYASTYSTITKTVDVTIQATTEKETLHLELNRDMISEENVTVSVDGTCTLHVYKYGLGDHSVPTQNYHYFTPNPILKTSAGATVPMTYTRGTGTWGDFKYLYVVMDGDNDNPGSVTDTDGKVLGTYYDNCEYAPFWNEEAAVAWPAGRKVLLNFDDNKFQVEAGKTGLVKVAVYAALPTDVNYGANLKAMYQPIMEDGNPKTMKDLWGADNYVYTEPVYFYIDVMKRVPELIFEPDPSSMLFTPGDKIDVNSRFLVSGHIDDNSNGIEGWLLFGANTGANPVYDATLGHEVDHFAYTFFISDRNKGKIVINDWPYMVSESDWNEKGGDQYSYIGYQTVVKGSKEIGKNIVAGDKVMIEGVLTEVTAGNIETIKTSHPTLEIGDQEKGIVYYSTRGFNEDFEKWTMEFKAVGSYDITYTIRPYNHPRWDVGSGDAGTVTYTYDVVETIPTKIDLSYTYTTTPNCTEWNFTKPDARVIAPSQNNFDVSEHFDLNYEIPSAYNQGGGTKDVVVLDETDFDGHTGTYSVYYLVTERNDDYEHTIKTKEPILAIEKSSGEVYVGCAWNGNVVIKVSADKNDSSPYEKPADEFYTIRIVDEAGLAKYEIIATCHPDPEDQCAIPSSKARFETEADFNKQIGRFHFIRPGELYGGTVIDGVPGIQMTIGSEPVNRDEVANWHAVETDKSVKYCCSHESDSHKPVAVYADAVKVDDNDMPIGGTFYVFKPTTNGYLSIDANWVVGEKVILISQNNKSGDFVSEEMTVTTAAQGDLTFKKALIAGETYYLYNRTAGFLRLHGFAYQPAFVFDRNTTKEKSEEPILATTYMNGLSTGIPTLVVDNNTNVAFTSSNTTIATVGSHNGTISPLQMTVNSDGTISYITISAVVTSSDENLRSCVNKSAEYRLRIIDIPSYVVGPFSSVTGDNKYHPVTNKTQVTTTNIPTAITMTFGGWDHDYSENANNDEYIGYDKGSTDKTRLTDSWSNKSGTYAAAQSDKGDKDGSMFDAYKAQYPQFTIDATHAGPASRIGGGVGDYDLDLNKPIDGFYFFTAAGQNPIDERGYGPLMTAAGNIYNYGSGTAAETSYKEVPLSNGSTQRQPEYNSTYRIPCKGAYVKFEPREGGIVMVYLVQNGSVDYHYGIKNEEIRSVEIKDGKSSQNTFNEVRWRPLYITDETGKPVEMVNDFGNAANYMTSYEDIAHTGSFTLALSRCNPIEPAIAASFDNTDPDCVMEPGCSFDFRQFRGTADDRRALIAAWPKKGERQSIIRNTDGGFAMPFKGYVRYAFKVMAGKSYFVFQPGSKFEFGGFSFVPDGYPNESTYGLTWTGDAADKAWREDVENIKTCTSWVGNRNAAEKAAEPLGWQDANSFGTLKENVNIAIKDAVATTGATRTLKANLWNSICLPFSVSEQEAQRVFGEDYFLLTAAGVDEKGQLHFERHAHQFIEAARPYLLKPKQDATLEFKNVTIEGNKSTFLEPTRFNVEADGYIFKGIYTQETMPKGSIIAGGSTPENTGLYSFTKPYNIGGYRAYFYLPTGQVSAKALTFSIEDLNEDLSEDEATGIMYTETDGTVKTLSKNAKIYNTSGQLVGEGVEVLNRLSTGIYIVNGEKYVVE